MEEPEFWTILKAPLYPRPTPPAGRIICSACGDITKTGHTSLGCKFLIWLDNKWKQ